MKTLINIDLIKTLEPCSNRLNNAITYYKDRSFTKGQLMGLKNITQRDKLWVAFRLMPKDKLRFAAAEIAEIVLPIFESAYPNDNRPRLAIEAAKAKDLDVDAAYYAANRAADSAAGAYAAASDAHSTTYADVYYATNAAYVAAYAAAGAADAAHGAAIAIRVTADAAYYAAATVSADQKLTTEKLIRKIVLKYWK